MPRTVLNWGLVRAVREAIKDRGVTYREIGARFGISGERVAELATGTTWKDKSYVPELRAKRKLSWDQVRSIRAAYKAGAKARALGLIFGISHVAVHKIVTGKVYRNDPTGAHFTPIHRMPQRANQNRKAA